jgi:hypothetical protein
MISTRTPPCTRYAFITRASRPLTRLRVQATGVEFGGNNLGIKGMALFLYSHSCTPLCEKLRLQPFDLWAPNKVLRLPCWP